MKILFVVYGLGIGGIEKCLVNLVNALPQDRYDVDILLMNPKYELKSEIRVKCGFLDSFQYVMNTTDTMKAIQNHGGSWINARRFLKYCAFRLAVKFQISPWKIFDPIPQDYDVAVAYSQNDYSPYYVIDKVNSKRKVLWYHNGAYEESGKRAQLDQIYYPQFDRVVAVSNDCARVLKSVFNFRGDQLVVLRNICDIDDIIQRSYEEVPEGFHSGIPHIVTVGRLTKEKGAEIALDVCSMLVADGRKFAWHWIGDGNQMEVLQSEINRRNLNNYFILEGSKQNPYPYMKAADFYVQPSFYEAYSTTITEAKILGKPIITTDVGGMRDQIENGKNGLIVSIDAAEIANVVKQLIEDTELRDRLSNALINEKVDSESFLREYEKTVFAEV